MSSSLKSKFINGVVWTAVSNFGTTIINFTLGIWLARILGPGVYGIMGMVLVITGFSRLLLDFGFGEALIQQKYNSTRDYSTVFWFNIILSFVLCLVIYVSADLIGEFFRSDAVIPITKAISFVIIINGLGIVQRIKLEKEMRFKEIGIAEVSSSFISVAMAIFFALNGFKIWSLVILNLSKPFLYALIIWLYSKWIPSFVFSFGSIKNLLGFSFSLFINGIFDTIASVLDRVLIGRNLGELNLGVYSKSTATVRLPVNTMMSAICRVIYPVFSKIQEDPQRIFKIYGQSVLIITSLIFPFAIIFYVFGSEIVKIVFGQRWLEMIPIFKIMSLGIVVLPFNILVDSVVKSSGNVMYLNFITFYEKPITIICLVMGVYIGNLYYIAMMVNISLFINFFLKSYIMTLSLKVSFSVLLINHITSLKFVALPIIALGFFSLTEYWCNIDMKLAVFLVAFILSFFIFRKELISLVKTLYFVSLT